MKAKAFLGFVAIILTLMFTISHQAQAQYWSSVGSGVPGWAYATCVYNGQLIAGGEFGIMAFNGANWSPVGGNVNGQVWALTVYSNQLWAGGSFFDAGGVPVSYIAFWDGTTWHDPEGGTDGMVRTLTSWNGLLIAGGYFTTANIPANHIASWNGHGWAALGAGTGGTQGQVMTLGTYGGELIAAGFFTTAGGLPANHIAKWNGSSWSTLGSGIAWIVYALTNYGGNLIAGGLFSQAGGIPANDVASWNGSSWAALGSGIGGGLYGYVLGLTADANYLYAGGMFTTAGGLSADNVAMWNGSAWAPMGSGMSNSGSTTAVHAMTMYGSNAVAAGMFTSAGGVSAGNIAQWTPAPSASFELTIAPINPPIEIPANGGNFQYDINVQNLTAQPQNFQVWNQILTPQGQFLPAFGPITRTLPGNVSATRTLSQTVAASVPAGVNTYISYIGTYPGTIQDSSFFTFTKLAVGDGGPWISETQGFGDFFDEYASELKPTTSALKDAFPNPFNPSTAISFQLSANSLVSLRVYDTAGRLVRTLVDGWREAGSYQLTFDASGLPSGIYLCRLQTGEVSSSQKLVLMK